MSDGWFSSWFPCCQRQGYSPAATRMDRPVQGYVGEEEMMGGPADGDARQYIYTVRHGEREDAVNEEWCRLSDRPYDPPLTAEGRCQARELGERLAALPKQQRPRVIVTSPFLRCAQTAALVYNELAQAEDAAEEEEALCRSIFVDAALGEVHCPTVLKHDRAPTFAAAKLEKDIAMLLSQGVKARVRMYLMPLRFPEPRHDAALRYDTAVAQYSTDVAQAVGARRLNAAMITHGEAVGRSVTSLRPTATVYNVEYCAFSTRVSKAADTPWALATASGESGVHWAEDMD